MSYRVNCVAVLLAFGLSAAASILFPQTPAVPITPTRVLAEGVVSFDPCMMWEQMPVIPNVAFLFWFFSSVFLIAKGLMNRAVARWVPILSMISYFAWQEHFWWRFTRCLSLMQQSTDVLFAAAFVWMCLQQILQRRPRPSTESPPSGSKSVVNLV